MSSSCVYLFSSDQSPLYVQDILNVLAAPPGYPYTFRYDSRYVTNDLREEWTALQDAPVLIVFSLQQSARLQPAAFIPIRTGFVLSSTSEGDSYFITFRLTDYAALPESTAEGAVQPQAAVAAFSSELRKNALVPYEASASRGAPPEGIDQSADASTLFQRITTYLVLADAFSTAYFLRMLGLKRSSSKESSYIQPPASDYVYSLSPGETYDLELFQTQQSTPETPVSFSVSVGGGLTILGRPDFVVASRYDRGSVRLVTPALPGLEDRDTQLVLAPGSAVNGPTLELPIRVKSQRGKAIGLAALQSIALIAVALAGSISSWATGTRLALALGGAVAASALGLLGATALKPPALPSTGR